MFVRKMNPSDVEQASKITKEVMLDSWERYERNYYPREALDFDISRHSAENYKESLRIEERFAFVAEEEGRIVGVVMGRIVGESGLATLGWIGVHPTYQRRGIGKALLETIINHCEAKGCHKITLYTMPVLIPAVNLYLKLGFVPEAYLHKEWWKTDFIKMSKWL